MGQVIDVPGHGPTEFPDDMSDDDIVAAIKANTSQGISAGEDAEKSAVGGLERGAAGMIMSVPNILNQVAAGPQLLGRGIAEGVDKLIGIQPQPRGDLWQPFYSSEDVLQALPESLRPHDAQTIGGVGADLIGQLMGGVTAGKALQKGVPVALESTKKLLSNEESGNIKPPPPRPLDADDLKTASQLGYDRSAKLGADFDPKDVSNKFTDSLEAAKPKPIAGKLITSEDAEFIKALDEFSVLRDTPMGLSDAEAIDKALGNKINSFIKNGKFTDYARKLAELQDDFREMIKNAPAKGAAGKEGVEALSDARELWAAQAKMRDLEAIVERADMMQHPKTGMRTGMANLVKNKRRFDSYDPETQELIRRASKTGIPGDILSIIGSRLNPIIGGTVGGPKGAIATQATSLAARSLSNKMQAARLQKVADSVANKARPAYERQMNPKPIAEEPPKQLTYQPKERDIAVGWDKSATRLTAGEQAIVDAARERAVNLGLDPTVIAAQEKHIINKMMQERGQSEIGRYAVENRHKPILLQDSEVPDIEYRKGGHVKSKSLTARFLARKYA